MRVLDPIYMNWVSQNQYLSILAAMERLMTCWRVNDRPVFSLTDLNLKAGCMIYSEIQAKSLAHLGAVLSPSDFIFMLAHGLSDS